MTRLGTKHYPTAGSWDQGKLLDKCVLKEEYKLARQRGEGEHSSKRKSHKRRQGTARCYGLRRVLCVNCKWGSQSVSMRLDTCTAPSWKAENQALLKSFCGVTDRDSSRSICERTSLLGENSSLQDLHTVHLISVLQRLHESCRKVTIYILQINLSGPCFKC